MQAMALGMPVIARRNDGNSAIIDHRSTGLLFDSPKVLHFIHINININIHIHIHIHYLMSVVYNSIEILIKTNLKYTRT